MNKKNLLILTVIFSVLFFTALFFEKFQDKVALSNIFKGKSKNNPSKNEETKAVKTEETKAVESNGIPVVVKSDISDTSKKDNTSKQKIQKNSIVLAKTTQPSIKQEEAIESKTQETQEKSQEDPLTSQISEDSSEELIINNTNQSSRDTSEEELIVNKSHEEESITDSSEEEFVSEAEDESLTTTESLFDRQTREERENNFKQGYNKPVETKNEVTQAKEQEAAPQADYSSNYSRGKGEESLAFPVVMSITTGGIIVYNVYQTLTAIDETQKIQDELNQIPLKKPIN